MIDKGQPEKEEKTCTKIGTFAKNRQAFRFG